MHQLKSIANNLGRVEVDFHGTRRAVFIGWIDKRPSQDMIDWMIERKIAYWESECKPCKS